MLIGLKVVEDWVGEVGGGAEIPHVEGNDIIKDRGASGGGGVEGQGVGAKCTGGDGCFSHFVGHVDGFVLGRGIGDSGGVVLGVGADEA